MGILCLLKALNLVNHPISIIILLNVIVQKEKSDDVSEPAVTVST